MVLSSQYKGILSCLNCDKPGTKAEGRIPDRTTFHGYLWIHHSRTKRRQLLTVKNMPENCTKQLQPYLLLLRFCELSSNSSSLTFPSIPVHSGSFTQWMCFQEQSSTQIQNTSTLHQILSDSSWCLHKIFQLQIYTRYRQILLKESINACYTLTMNISLQVFLKTPKFKSISLNDFY